MAVFEKASKLAKYRKLEVNYHFIHSFCFRPITLSMSDISPSSLSTLSQALTQLNQLAPTSGAAQRGIEIIVKYLSNNALSLTKTSGLVSRQATVKVPEIQGELKEGKHQVRLSLKDVPSLEFSAQANTKLTPLISLKEQQVQSLLQLPAKQLLRNIQTSKNESIRQLVELNATILPNDSKVSKSVIPDTIKQSSHIELNTNNLRPNQANRPTNQLKLTLTDQHPSIQTELPIKQSNQFKVGDRVVVSLVPKGVNWQITISKAPSTASSVVASQLVEISKDALQLNLSKAEAPTTKKPTGIDRSLSLPTELLPAKTTKTDSVNSPQGSESQVSPIIKQTTTVRPSEASTILKVAVNKHLSTDSLSLELPIKQVIKQLNKIHTEQNHVLVSQLKNTPTNTVTLQLKTEENAQLLAQVDKPVARIHLTSEILEAIRPLKLPNQEAIVRALDSLRLQEKETAANIQPSRSPKKANTKINKAPEPANVPSQNNTNNNLRNNTKLANNLTHAAPLALKTNTHAVSETPLKATAQQNIPKEAQSSAAKPNQAEAQLPKTKPSLDELASRLTKEIQNAPQTTSVITPILLKDRSEQTNLVQSLLRIVQAKAESPSISLQALEKTLTDGEFFKAPTEAPTKQLVSQVLQQVKQSIPTGTEQDVNQIKQIITSPALNLSSTQLLSPTSNQGLIGGLVTLLQVSLSSRLSRNQTSRSEYIAQVLGNILTGSGKNKQASTPKAISEFSQLEQKHQLIREVGRLLSGHQANKLANAEQMLQGQETFYYNLPSALGGYVRDIEMLIRREENPKDEEQQSANGNKTWHLTLKLGVGELGELLTKAKLRPDNVDVNFYASNDTVKIQVMNYLPLLKKRLKFLGIDVGQSAIQLGKIPDSLQQRPYHVFQAKA